MDDRKTTVRLYPLSSATRRQHDLTPTGDVNARRSNLAETLNIATSVFLSHDEESFDDMVTHGLVPIANAVGIDRVCIYQDVHVDGKTRFLQIYRWCRLPDETLPAIPYLLPESEIADGWHTALMGDECVHLRQSEMSEEEWYYLHTAGISSMYIVPIFMRHTYWGSIALQNTTNDCYFEDDCLDLLQSAARLFAFAYVRTEAEIKAEELRNYNATLFDSAPIGLAVFNEDCKIVDSNEAFLRMHGVDKQTLLRQFFHLLPEFQPDGMKSADKAIDTMKRALAGEQMVIEWMHKSATGEPVPSELTLTSMVRDGKRYGLAYIYDLRYVKSLEADTKQHREKAAMTRVWERAYKDLRKKVENLGINVDQLQVIPDDVPKE